MVDEIRTPSPEKVKQSEDYRRNDREDNHYHRRCGELLPRGPRDLGQLYDNLHHQAVDPGMAPQIDAERRSAAAANDQLESIGGRRHRGEGQIERRPDRLGDFHE